MYSRIYGEQMSNFNKLCMSFAAKAAQLAGIDINNYNLSIKKVMQDKEKSKRLQ